MTQQNKETIMRNVLICIALWLTAVTAALAQTPQRPVPQRLVNDLAGLMNPDKAEALEDSLVRFSRATSTQVAVVTVSSLGGRDIAEFAQELGEKWGVGDKKKDNGVVIIVKPKNDDGRGQAFIGTGYGLEGALPDITCTAIVRDKMIPHFKNNDYSAGIEAGAAAVMRAVRGEYSADGEEEDVAVAALCLALAAIFVVVVLAVVLGSSNNSQTGADGGHISWGGLDAGGNAHTSSSIGGIGGSGGISFGGFGGGHFGGGGGGGSW